MANKTRQILIESILGGQSPMSHFAGSDQFKASLGIDPALPAVDNNDPLYKESGITASGLIRPASYVKLANSNSTTMAGTPMWLIQNPKNQYTYVYDSVGSIYSIGSDYYSSFTGLGDLGGSVGSVSGNGSAYYDNYIYFATGTTVARYGPLNGTPSFTYDYWVTTLSKTALSNTTYPQVTITGSGNYSLDLDADLLQYAYRTSNSQTNLGFSGDMTIEAYINMRDLVPSGGKYGVVSMAKKATGFGNNYCIDLEHGSGQYLTASDSASLSLTSDFTIELWINPESSGTPDNSPLISKNDGSGNQRAYTLTYTPAGSITVSLSSDGSSATEIERTIAGGFTVGSWQHLAVVYTASIGKVEVFKNGVSTGSDSSFPTSVFNSTATFAVGNNSLGSSSRRFDGLIDDIRIWNVVKTGAQILANMSAELNGTESNLQAYWKLNNALTDSTSNANTLTNVNGAVFSTSVPFGGWQAYWKLDNSLTDSVGSRTLTNNGGTTFVTGVIGSSASFNGTTQYLSRASETLGIANTWTVTAWVKPTVTIVDDYILSWTGASGQNQIQIVLDGANKLRVVITDIGPTNYKDYHGSTVLSLNTFYHICVTWDGSNLILYVNGVAETLTKDLDQGLTMTDTSRLFYMGGSAGTNFSDVVIDEVGYANRVFTSTEIDQLYNSGNGYTFTTNATDNYSLYLDYDGVNQGINFTHTNSALLTETVSVDWSPSAGSWYHIACSISGSTVAFYVNGVAYGSTGTLSYARSINANNEFRVGATALVETFDGKIDEVRVWNDTRSAGEILANKDVELTGAESNLISYWKFNNDYDDANTNSNDLTGFASPSFSGIPAFGIATVLYPNHVMHRHSNGKLYFADVVGNQGVLHVIDTTKTTVEGDTNNNSTYNVIDFGYGLYPTAIASYGASVVVALYEGSDTGVRGQTAKLAFWDTTSDNFNSIVFVEFPDSLITALKNINGVLYIVSTNSLNKGFRLSRLVGGYTVEEVVYNEFGQAPLAGGVDGTANRILFASATDVPEASACAFSYGLQKGSLSNGLFNIAGFTDGAMATSLIIPNMSTETGDANSGFGFYTPMVGWSGASYDGEVSVIKRNTDYTSQVWWSQMYRIGQPFKITKIRIPLAQSIIDGMVIVPKIYVDGGATVYTLTEINNTNDSGKYNILRRADANGATITGQNNFFIAFEWNGTKLITPALPILIEYETTDD